MFRPPAGALHSISRRWGLSLAVLLVLTGCSGGGDGPAGTERASTSDVPATQSPIPTGLELRPIVWATAIDQATGAPDDRLEVFPRDVAMIYAVIETGELPEGTTFEARWSFDGELIPELTTSVTIEETRGAGWIPFDLTWSGATFWPIGTLSVEITASSGEVVRSSVEIQ